MEKRIEPRPHSKEPSRVTGYMISNALKPVTISVQIFRDHIFIKARWLPYCNSGPIRSNSITLPVLCDQSAQQVKLWTGYHSHIAGNPILHMGKN